MILLVAGRPDTATADALLVLAARLGASGHRDVAIEDGSLPADLDRNLRYEAAPYLTDPSGRHWDRVLCLASSGIDAERLVALRRIAVTAHGQVALLGRFADQQARISAEAGLTFAFARTPLVVDLGTMAPRPLSGAAIGLTHALRSQGARRPGVVPGLAVFLSRTVLDQPETLPALSAIHHERRVRLTIVTDGATRDAIRQSRHTDLVALRHSDLPAASLAQRFDLAAVYRDEPPGDRLGAVLTDMIAAGKPVIDGTTDRTLLATGAPVLPGPASLAGLSGYLAATVLPHYASIASRVAASPWSLAADFVHLEAALGLSPPEARRAKARRGGPAADAADGRLRTVFLPTNGVGLGHARRCLLIAGAMGPADAVAFAAFPSCVPMIGAQGYGCLPLVARDGEHGDPGANDLVNHLRLGRGLGPGDRLVFDGGYVFTSVYRAIMEQRLPSVWIRRGLWQAGQRGPRALESEAAFDRVIVPSEAFDDLNDDLSHGSKVVRVGPVVDLDGGGRDRTSVRAALAVQAGRPFDRLVVTMLGGGVAADRTAQTMALCTLLERRADVLHLIVVWPGARIPAGLAGWKASRLVRTHAATGLMRAADVVVTAAGYNAFHEALYHRVPAIFVPQMAPYMDDQDRRARAASDRGLAMTVAGHELLGLDHALTEMLDAGGAGRIAGQLAALTLPETGTAAAAGAIAEVTG